jgi:predicted nucleic acid-binding protein
MRIATIANPFLDSSFLVKLYLPEADSRAAMRLFVRLQGLPMISSLTDVEVASAILRRVPAQEATVIYAKYRANRDAGVYGTVDIDGLTFRAARELVERYARLFSLRSLDAMQLASALQNGAREFVTFDGNLAKAATAEGLTVLQP